MTIVSESFDLLGCGDADTVYKLGIMGGTFDPIHIGHLACAEQVRDGFGLDAVVFIPTGNPVFKQESRVTSAEKRLEMCRLACTSNPAFEVSALEVERAGITYTIDTLRQLRTHFPANVELFFITGADAVLNILKWKDGHEIPRLAHLVAATRPGYLIDDETKDFIERCSKGSGNSVNYVEVTALTISSSDLRRRCREGRSIRYLTMQCVCDHIRDQGLYTEEEGA